MSASVGQEEQPGAYALPADLLARRVQRAQQMLAQEGLDALVVYSRGHITQYGGVEFLTGYTPVARAHYAVLTRTGSPVLIAPTPADRWFASRLPGSCDVRLAGEGDVVSGADDLAGAAAAVLVQRGLASGRIGVSGLRTLLPVGEHEALSKALPHASLLDADPLLTRLKLVKEPQEIEAVRLTASIADEGVLAAQRSLRAGVSDSEVGATIRAAVFAQGARDALVFVSAEPYFLSWSRGRRFRDGDLVTVYVEIVGPSGCWVEVGALMALGVPSPEHVQVAETCMRAAERAESLLRPGVAAADVARAIEQVAAGSGLHAGLWHGHGVGIDHDAPVISVADQTVLQPGMVLAVHPSCCTSDERFGASVVDTYVVGQQRPERLSAVPQRILQAGKGDERWAG